MVISDMLSRSGPVTDAVNISDVCPDLNDEWCNKMSVSVENISLKFSKFRVQSGKLYKHIPTIFAPIEDGESE